jgi:SAM-dependent methyltransferase
MRRDARRRRAKPERLARSASKPTDDPAPKRKAAKRPRRDAKPPAHEAREHDAAKRPRSEAPRGEPSREPSRVEKPAAAPRAGAHATQGRAAAAQRAPARGTLAGGERSYLRLDTSERFGWEWRRYRRFFPHYERQFKGWIAPLEPGFFQAKDVLDAGCGMGRNSFWAARHGARSVLAVDHAEPALASAREVLSGVPGTAVERCNLYELPYEAAFDLVFSIGVIHHLEDPRRALERLVRALRPGGTLLVWVYGRDGLGPWATFVRALLPILRRLPPRVVHTLAYALSLPIWLGLRLPLRWSGYLAEAREFPFAHLHKIVFDQLVPDVARYYRREELEALFAGLPLARIAVHPNRGYSWTIVCEK